MRKLNFRLLSRPMDATVLPAGFEGERWGGLTAWFGTRMATAVMLGVIVLFGAWLRLQHTNWDQGQHLHPDERFLSIVSSQIRAPESLGQYWDSDASPLNPYNYGDSFVYGTLPMFLNKAAAEWLDRDQDGSTHASADAFRSVLSVFGIDLQRDDGSLAFDGGYNSNLVGRALSGLIDLATILLVFELGRLLYGRTAGLLAAALMSVTVLHIQLSHFFGMETWLAFFVTAVVYFSVRIVKFGGGWNYAFAGLAMGLALATKLSGLPVLPVLGLAVLIRAWPALTRIAAAGPEARIERGDVADLLAQVAWSAVMVAVGLLAFRVAQPYAFAGPGFFDIFKISLDLPGDLFSTALIDPVNYLDLNAKFVQDITNLQNQRSGADFPPNIQWIGRPFLVFPLKNMALWGLGLPLALAAFGGSLYALRRGLLEKDWPSLLLVVWVAVLTLYIALSFNPTMRYLMSIYPTLVVLAAAGLVQLWRLAAGNDFSRYVPAFLRRIEHWGPPLARGAVVFVVAGTALWALAFTGVYRQDISRVQASHWIAENVLPGSKLSYEEWDDAVPLGLPGVDTRQWEHVVLKPYVTDSGDKVRELVAGLAQVDYVIETSNRLYGSIPRIPARYPSTVRYYDALFDGSLGFEEVAEFTNYPSLLGIEIPDQSADEAFTVYDHPKVIIWRKTEAFSVERALAILDPYSADTAVSVPPSEAAQNALLLRPDDLRTQQEGGTWTDVFNEGGLAGNYPTLLWLLALEGAAFAVAPITLSLFKRLPDRGYLLSKPLGLLVLAYVTWLIVSLKLVHFEQTTILAVLLCLGVAGAVTAWRWRGELSAYVREQWRHVLFCEGLFLAAFALFWFLRVENPDLWHPFRGGEKPMDLAYLTAVTRSTTLPPYDPWFAGGYINYYYLGQFFTATLSKLTTITPEVAFNLAVPTYFALTCAGAFTVVYNLAAACRRLVHASQLVRPRASLYLAGLLGVFLVAIAGNLDGVGQLVERLSEVSSVHLGSGIPVLDSVVNSLGGAWQVLFHGAALRDFDFWRSSRMMPPTISITEFPFFSFLFADLHAHMMAIAFQVLAIGAALALVLQRPGEQDRWRELGLIVLLGLIVGSLRWLNSWDYPPFLLLSLAAVLIAERHLEGGASRALLRAAVKGGLLVALSFAFFQPFLANYRTPVAGVTSSPEQTPIHQYLAHFGLFAAVIFVALAVWSYRVLRTFRLGDLTSGATYERRASRQTVIALMFGGALGVSFLMLFLAVSGQPLVAALLPVFVVVCCLAIREVILQRPDGGIRLFVLSLIGLGLGLSMGVDVIILQGDIVRMNTVFKFYLHVWVLFALASAFLVWQLLYVYWAPLLARRPVPSLRLPRLAVSGAVTGLVLLLLGVLLYPVFATPVRLNDRFEGSNSTGLDGEAYARVSVYSDEHGPIALSQDLDGIEWMRHNVEGTPVIVEGRAELYRWGGRFSIYTGLPAVIGWDWHQTQQRGDFAFMVQRRVMEVDNFYNTPDEAAALRFLATYDVRYVVLGQLERYYYAPGGLAKLDAGLGGVLKPVFQNQMLTIFEVQPERLATLAR